MADRIRFNKATVAGIEPPERGRIYVYDTRVAGLAVCVSATGRRTFYSYRKINRRPVRVRLGAFPEITVEQARQLAAKINSEIADGGDPHARKIARRNEATFADLCTYWIERAKGRKRTWKTDQRHIDKFLGPWQSRPLRSIGKPDVVKLHATVGKENGPYEANRLLALVRAMFNRADDLGFEGRNPAVGVERFKEKSRDRFLQADELPRFFRALAEEPDLFRDFFLMALFTGARRGNVQAMRWADIDLESRTWRIPETKTGDPVIVPLVEPAMRVLEARNARRNGSPWVFPGPGKAGHLIEPKAAWKRVCERAQLEDLRIHDLRRTLGSWQAITGASLSVIGKSLGHKQTSTTAVYARLTMDPVREATDKATAAMLKAGGISSP